MAIGSSARVTETRIFEEGSRNRSLLFQRCIRCGATQIYPRRRCSECHGPDLGWHQSGRRGRVLSYTIVHRAPNTSFAQRVPYGLVIVELAEGFRLMTNVLGDEALLTIDAPVEIVFAPDFEGRLRPQAKLG